MPQKKRKGSQKPVEVTESEKVESSTDGSSESVQEEKETKKPERANKRKQKDDEIGTVDISAKIQDEIPSEPVKRGRGAQRKKNEVEPKEPVESEVADGENAVRKGRGRAIKEDKVVDDIQKPVRELRKRINEEKPPAAKAKKSKVPNTKNKKDKIDEITSIGNNADAIDEGQEGTKKSGRRGRKIVELGNVEQEKVHKGGRAGPKEKSNGVDATAKPARGRKKTATDEKSQTEKPKLKQGRNKKTEDEMISENQQLSESPENKKAARLSKKFTVTATKGKRGKRVAK